MTERSGDRAAPPLRHPVLDESKALREKADSLGLTCPEPQFLGWRNAHRFRCSFGHEFALTPTAVMRALARCPACEQEDHVAKLQSEATRTGLQLLEYTTGHGGQRLSLRCPQGHAWTGRMIKSCPVCEKAAAGLAVDDAQRLKGLRELAEDRGGQCLAPAYLGQTKLHRFLCERGHEFDAMPGGVHRGRWCPECTMELRHRAKFGPDVLRKLQRVAEEKGGKLVATRPGVYERAHRFRCSNLHTWWASGGAILRGGWCEKCRRGEERLKIAQAVAKERGGRCLSTDGSNVRQPLFWACSEAGHVWRAQLHAVRRGLWCLECAKEKRGTGRLSHLGGPLPFLFYAESGAKEEWASAAVRRGTGKAR